MPPDAIIEKYSEKIVGRAAYKNGADYKASELANPDEAYIIMGEIWNHEGYLTKHGLDFLTEYYGLENFAELLSEKGGFDEAKDKTAILEWLKGMETLP